MTEHLVENKDITRVSKSKDNAEMLEIGIYLGIEQRNNRSSYNLQ